MLISCCVDVLEGQLIALLPPSPPGQSIRGKAEAAGEESGALHAGIAGFTPDHWDPLSPDTALS